MDDTYDRQVKKATDDERIDEIKQRRENFLNIYKESNDKSSISASEPDISKGIRYKQEDDLDDPFTSREEEKNLRKPLI